MTATLRRLPTLAELANRRVVRRWPWKLYDAFAASRRLYCPRCGDLLDVDWSGGDERHFSAYCITDGCDWPAPPGYFSDGALTERLNAELDA